MRLDRDRNGETRQSALWGKPSKGETRSSALWGKPGRGFVVMALVVALAAPVAATAGERPSSRHTRTSSPRASWPSAGASGQLFYVIVQGEPGTKSSSVAIASVVKNELRTARPGARRASSASSPP